MMTLRTKLTLKTKSGTTSMDIEFGKGKKVAYVIRDLIKYFLSKEDIEIIKQEMKNH